MKKITFAIILFIACFSNVLKAQSNFKVGISMGTVLPIGSFGSNDINDNTSGFSENGFTLNFDGDYYLINRLALSARFHFGLTPMNEASVAERLNSMMIDYSTNNNENNLYNIDYWQWSAPLLGLKYNYPLIVNKLYIETGIFSGLSISPIPAQNLMIPSDDKSTYSENNSGTDISMPIMVDAGIRFIANSNIEVKLQSSYFSTSIDFEHYSYIIENNSATVSEEINKVDFSIPLKAVSLSIGIIYRL